MKRKKINSKKRTANITTYILVDGECEKDYLSSMCENEVILKNKRIHIKPDIPSKKKLRDQFKVLKDSLNHYDIVIWIVDYDVISSQNKEDSFNKYSSDLKNLVKSKKYKDKKVFVLVNNPSIEYWYLMHFVFTEKPYKTSEQVENDLKKHWDNYTKMDKKFRKSVYPSLKNKLDTAINNAKRGFLNNKEGSRTEMYNIFIDDFNMFQ